MAVPAPPPAPNPENGYDAERWLPAPNWPAYEVSSYGHVRRVKPGPGARVGRILRELPHCAGYPMVAPSDGPKTQVKICVHDLVCTAFHGPKPTLAHEVAHGDGNPKNNREDNLRWATRKENAQDAIRHGRTIRGEKQWNAKLTTDVALRLRAARGTDILREIAKEAGITRGYAVEVAVGRKWAWLSELEVP